MNAAVESLVPVLIVIATGWAIHRFGIIDDAGRVGADGPEQVDALVGDLAAERAVVPFGLGAQLEHLGQNASHPVADGVVQRVAVDRCAVLQEEESR